MKFRRVSALLSVACVAVGLGVLAAACGSSAQGGASSPTPDAAGTGLRGDITVFAAASLTDAFTALGKQFESAHPGTHVTFNFAASSALALQINEGAPADVFASADQAQMKVVTDKGNAANPRIFVTNVPVVVVPKGDRRVTSFADLASAGVKLVLAAPEVPIGKYARTILQNATGPKGVSANFSEKVLQNLQSNEANVRAVLAKIEVGEADAGIVYTTDAATATRDTRTIAIPQEYNVIAQYPIATVRGSKHADVARAFVAYVLSDAGRAVLHNYGFGPPPGGAGGNAG